MLSSFILAIVSFLQHVKFDYLYIALGIYLFILWVFFSIWVWNDTKNRFGFLFVRIAMWLFTTLTFIFGLILYLLVRPEKKDEDTHWVNLERRYLQYETYGMLSCHICQYDLRPEFFYCPSCGEKLREKCLVCSNTIDVSWKICPFCADKKAPIDKKPLPKRKFIVLQAFGRIFKDFWVWFHAFLFVPEDSISDEKQQLKKPQDTSQSKPSKSTHKQMHYWDVLKKMFVVSEQDEQSEKKV